MSELKTTSGPWQVCEYKGEFYVADRHAVALWNDRGALYNLEDGHLIAKAPEMLELLKEVQWCDSGDNWPTSYCPFCGWHRNNGHSDDCKLGNLLKELK